MLAAKMRLITYIDKAGASETLAFHRALRRYGSVSFASKYLRTLNTMYMYITFSPFTVGYISPFFLFRFFPMLNELIISSPISRVYPVSSF